MQYRDPSLCWLILGNVQAPEPILPYSALELKVSQDPVYSTAPRAQLGKLHSTKYLEPCQVGPEHLENTESEGEQLLLPPCGR